MKHVLMMFIVFFLSACSIDSSITVIIENNSDKEITGKMYVSNEVLVENISVLPNSQEDFTLSLQEIKNLVKQQKFSVGDLKISTIDNMNYEICGYIEYDVCGQTSFHMTIKEDMSYEVEYK
jgi:predicted nucleic-acid-binding protein